MIEDETPDDFEVVDLEVDELDEELIGDDDETVDTDVDVVLDDVVVDVVVEDEEAPEVPVRRKRPGATDEDEEEEEEADPDDVEADLDTILKDRIASGDDLDEEEEEEVPDRNDPDTSDGVVAKKEGEFTCPGCFMIVHPRQFGRRAAMVCPEGYEPCPAMDVVRTMR